MGPLIMGPRGTGGGRHDMNPRIGQGALQDIRHVVVIPVRLGDWRLGGDGGGSTCRIWAKR